MSNPVEADRVAEQLAEFERNAEARADSTLENLHRELETLAGELRLPVEPDEYEDETECQRAVERVLSLPSPQPSPTEPTCLDVRPGVLVGQYRLEAKLGEGGMGTVYKARHPKLDKVVALKVLPTDRMRHADLVARFEREMLAIGKVEHPNLVRASDAGEVDGVHYLVMEFVDGIDLKELSSRRGPLPVAESCEMIRQAALGLAVAHEHGMIHRDIKPANMMLAREPVGSPNVKVLDLGLALIVDDREADSGLTHEGQIMGTFDYMAPEQADDSHSVDHRVDVYSLGASLFTLLTGRPLFDGPGFESRLQKLSALATQPTPSIRALRPNLPGELAIVIEKMLAKNPENRFDSATEVADALAPFCAGADLAELLAEPSEKHETPTRAVPPTITAPSPAPKRGPWLVALALVVMLIPMGYFFGGPAYRYLTNQGELVVEVDDPSIEVKVIQNGVVVQDATTKRSFTLTASKGTLEIVEKDGIKVKSKTFELTRGGKTTVRISLKEIEAGKKAEEPKVAPDRRAAEYVISVGGRLRINTSRRGEYIYTLDELPKEPFRLTTVDLSQNKKVTDEGLAAFADCKNLRILILDRSKITDKGVAHFAECRWLIALGLAGTRVTDAGLRHFANCPNLADVLLDDTAITDAGLAHLQGMTYIRQLMLNGTQVTGSGFGHLKACRATLAQIHLRGTPCIDKSLELLADCERLQIVDVRDTKVTQAGVEKLSKTIRRPGRVLWDKPTP